MNLIETFDTESYLTERSIEYRTRGKDISPGWIGIKCFQCDDPEFHLGVNLTNSKFDRNFITCWRCGFKGNFWKVLKELEKSNAGNILRQFQDRSLQHLLSDNEPLIRSTDLVLPLEVSKNFLPCHHYYLTKRRYESEILIRKYDLYAGGYMGKYRYRIIIPVFYKGQMVTFIARDISGEAEESYLAFPKEHSVLFSKETIYNIDSVRNKTAIIVEGPADVWRLGDGCVCTYGVKYTTAQVKILIDNCDKVFIIYDSEDAAQEMAEKLMWDLSVGIKKIQNVKLPKGDPDDLTDEEALYVRKQLLGR